MDLKKGKQMVHNDYRHTPLCVDLDGTLIWTDMLWESLIALVKENPLELFILPFILLKGKAFFKRYIAEKVDIDASTLPYQESVLEYIKGERTKGRKIVLVTASDALLAQGIADHLGCFEQVIASNGESNLLGKEKADKLVSLFGFKGFEYVGNSKVDIHIWREAESATVVSHSKRFIHEVEKHVRVNRCFSDKKPVLPMLWKAIRPHQWVKNILVFVPLVAAHQIFSPTLFIEGLLAFVVFSLCASSAYIFNDIMDLDSDRNHAIKKSRPFASGQLSIPLGLFISMALLLGSFSLAALLSKDFQMVLASYFILTILYSLVLKSRLLVDVFTLTILYTLRIFAGGVATGLLISYWLLAFSMFLFLSLAFIKRYTELEQLKDQGKEAMNGRDYLLSDLNYLGIQGVVSGYLASLILVLYVNSQVELTLYSHAYMLWFLPPLMLYWISRVWMITFRGEMHSDPIVFALKDSISYFVLVMLLIVVWVAM